MEKKLEMVEALASLATALSIEQFYRVLGYAEGLAAKRESEAVKAATA